MPHTSVVDCRVLIVEDEYFLASDLERALTSAGVKVLGPVPTCQEALDLLQTHEIEIAILDINLAGGDVFPVARALQARAVPIVFATGYDRGSLPDEFHDTPLWEKPFEVRVLVDVLPRLKRSPPD